MKVKMKKRSGIKEAEALSSFQTPVSFSGAGAEVMRGMPKGVEVSRDDLKKGSASNKEFAEAVLDLLMNVKPENAEVEKQMEAVWKMAQGITGDLAESDNPYKQWQETHGEVGQKYVEPSGKRHDEPWERNPIKDPLSDPRFVTQPTPPKKKR